SIPVKPDFFEQFMNGSRHPGGSNALPIGPPAPGRPRETRHQGWETMADMKTMRDKVSFWREPSMRQVARDYPWGVALVFLLGVVFWFGIVGPLLD
ncbi:hypothetical protein, partial [Streptomyces rhizosphaericus]